MVKAQTPDEQEHVDFLISYAGQDQAWAEWMALQLEAAGYQILIQAWDVRPGSNFVVAMDEAIRRAERTVLVLSPAYLATDDTFAQWVAAFRRDPRGKD